MDLNLQDIIHAFALCHNVIPTENENDFQASSPDEVALVQIAQNLGIKLIARTQKTIIIENPEKSEQYEILANFPFSSERKRMGIVLRNCQDQQKIMFLLKGADVVMKNTVPEVKSGFLLDECEKLANMGLRTLVFSQKILDLSDFEKWNQKYNEAQMSLEQRDVCNKYKHILWFFFK